MNDWRAEAIRRGIINAIVNVAEPVEADREGMAARKERMLQEYEATWACERESETWRDCPSETGPNPPHRGSEDLPETFKWCRSCLARKALE